MPETHSHQAPWILFGAKKTDGSCPKEKWRFTPYVHGMIVVDGRGKLVHRDSACGPTSTIARDAMQTFDFDSKVAIFENDIYVRVNRDADVVRPVAYCTNAGLDGEFEVGTSVFIYQKGKNQYGTIAQGKHLGDQYLKFRVDPFVVNQVTTASAKEFSLGLFKLNVVRNGAAKTIGHLNVLLDGENVDLGMVCYLNLP